MDIYCWKYRYETVQSESVVNNQETYWLQKYLPESKFDQPQTVTSCLLNNVKFKSPNCHFTREVNQQLKEEWNSFSADQNLGEKFMDDEIIAAIKSLKASKAPGADNLQPDSFFTSMKTAFNGYDRSSTSICTRKKYPKYWNLQKWLPCLNKRNHQMSQAATDQLPYFVFLLNFTNA